MSEGSGAGPIVVHAEWFDRMANSQRPFRIRLFPADSTVDIYDLKVNKTFLKRVPCAELRPSQFFEGASVSLFGRIYRVVALQSQLSQVTVGLVSAALYETAGRVVEAAAAAGLSLRHARLLRDGVPASVRLAAPLGEAAAWNGPVLAMALQGDDAAAKWAKLAALTGEAGRALAEIVGPAARSGLLYASPDAKGAESDLKAVFGADKQPQQHGGSFAGCTTCVIKPHAVTAGATGRILDAVLQDGFEVAALSTFRLGSVEAAEFLEVYKGVVPDYNQDAVELASGSCVAMALYARDRPVEAFRELCGPADPEIARLLRPNSLRALFGSDRAHNAVHCTDLPEDGATEAEYFFEVLRPTCA